MQVAARRALDLLADHGADLGLDLADDVAGDLVLDLEDVFQVPVVALGPDMTAGAGIDELGGDPDALPGAAHGALDDVVGAEFRRQLADVGRAALVGKGGVARDHVEPAVLGERGDDVLGQPVGEIRLLRIAGHVLEGQHGDAGLGRAVLDLRGDGPLRGPAPDADRARDVLQLLLAGILQHQIERARQVILHRARQADAAGLGDLLQPGGDVDPVAEQVVAVAGHVAEVDADAEPHLLAAGQVAVSVGEVLLDRHSTTRRLDRAGELGDDAVAGAAEDAAEMPGDPCIDGLSAGGESGQSGLLVRLHEAGIADDIGGEYGGQAAFHFNPLGVQTNREGSRNPCPRAGARRSPPPPGRPRPGGRSPRPRSRPRNGARHPVPPARRGRRAARR